MALFRVEDRRLLTGRGVFIDDMQPVPHIHHAAVLRSPHAHARIRGIDASEALAMPGVVAVMTGADVARMSKPFSSALPRQAAYYSCAVDKARFAGEPVAVVVATSRYKAEDAMARIQVTYEPLPAIVDPEQAVTDPDAPLLHEDVGTNVALHRLLNYGEVDRALAEADVTIKERFVFPKYGSTPLETYGVIAHWEPAEGVLTIWSNFHGPFSMHPVVAQSLGLSSNHLRFIVPWDVGGGFGIKTSIYPYLALIGLAARHAGVPVKWIEDRQEHLSASSSSTDRVSYVELAAKKDGTLLGVKMTIYDNVGGYFRPPEPGCIFRPLGNYVGGYKYRNLRVDGYCCFTNKSLTGPNRGYGCQELYFGVERCMDILAQRLGLDPVEVRRRNLIPKDAFPYTTPTGGLYDAGDYEACLDKALAMCNYEALRAEQREARQAGRLFGIGIACGVDPSVSNMGYVDIAATPEERAKRRGKSGATQATTIQIDDLGKVTVELSTTPQGQSHETVVREYVARELGLPIEDVTVVSGMDTATRAWTIPSGSYSSRFASIGISSAVVAARKVREKLFQIAAHELEARVDDLELTDGLIHVKGAPRTGISVKHAAGIAHWDPQALPPGLEPGLYVTHYHTMPTARRPDANDCVNSSNTYGFMFDICACEIDPESGEIEIKHYWTAHDSGVILNHVIAEGQVRGAFVHGLGGAMYEEMVYDSTGNFLAGTFMDYLCPTFMETPPLDIGHVEVPSPFTVLGSKGLGESTAETAPVCVANAVSDALSLLGIAVNELPVTPVKVWRALTQSTRARGT